MEGGRDGGGPGIPRPRVVPPVADAPIDLRVPAVRARGHRAAQPDPRSPRLHVQGEGPLEAILHPIRLAGRGGPYGVRQDPAPPGNDAGARATHGGDEVRPLDDRGVGGPADVGERDRAAGGRADRPTPLTALGGWGPSYGGRVHRPVGRPHRFPQDDARVPAERCRAPVVPPWRLNRGVEPGPRRRPRLVRGSHGPSGDVGGGDLGRGRQPRGLGERPPDVPRGRRPAAPGPPRVLEGARPRGDVRDRFRVPGRPPGGPRVAKGGPPGLRLDERHGGERPRGADGREASGRGDGRDHRRGPERWEDVRGVLAGPRPPPQGDSRPVVRRRRPPGVPEGRRARGVPVPPDGPGGEASGADGPRVRVRDPPAPRGPPAIRAGRGQGRTRSSLMYRTESPAAAKRRDFFTPCASRTARLTSGHIPRYASGSAWTRYFAWVRSGSPSYARKCEPYLKPVFATIPRAFRSSYTASRRSKSGWIRRASETRRGSAIRRSVSAFRRSIAPSLSRWAVSIRESWSRRPTIFP